MEESVCVPNNSHTATSVKFMNWIDRETENAAVWERDGKRMWKGEEINMLQMKNMPASERNEDSKRTMASSQRG